MPTAGKVGETFGISGMRSELLFLLFFVACVYAAETSKYTTRYDHINLDSILYNNRLLRSYYNCMMGVGRCTAEGNKLKQYFPEVLQTKCAKCTPHQKKKIKRTAEFLMKYKPEMWEGMMRKYDPSGKLIKEMLNDPGFLNSKKAQ